MFTFVVTSGASVAYTIDTARTGLATLQGDSVIPAGGETRAWPNQVAHFDDKAVPGVKMEDGATQFLVDGVDQPVIAARPLAQSSLTWSPSKTRLTYAGKLDACKILKGESKDKNELYVYDKTKHTAQRIATAVSSFATLWLDDDRLVYEGGVGKDGKIQLYTFSSHADEALPTRHGAGLYGVPTLACEQAEGGIDEDVGPEDPKGTKAEPAAVHRAGERARAADREEGGADAEDAPTQRGVGARGHAREEEHDQRRRHAERDDDRPAALRPPQDGVESEPDRAGHEIERDPPNARAERHADDAKHHQRQRQAQGQHAHHAAPPTAG